MQTLSIDHNGAPIAISLTDVRQPWHVDRLGEQTIIFHHGLGACGEIWKGWMPALTARYRIVTFDMRGHGASPVPPEYPWSIASMVDDLKAVADEVVSGPFHLVGESIGGTIALAFAVQHAAQLQSLTISNGTHQGGAIENLKPWERIIETGGTKAWSQHMMGERFYDDAIPADAYAWYEAQQATVDPDALLRAARMLAGADLTDQLDRVTMPTLLLHPDNSPFIPVTTMAHLHAVLPNAQLQVFANTRHGLPFSHARATSRCLRRFLQNL